MEGETSPSDQLLNRRFWVAFVTLALAWLVTPYLRSPELRHTLWPIFFLGIGFTHYGLGAYYSKGGFSRSMRSLRPALILLVMLVLSVLATRLMPPPVGLYFYFGLHHAMSEAFFHAQEVSDRKQRGVMTIHFLLILAQYFVIFNAVGSSHFPWLINVSFGLVVLLYGLYFVETKRAGLWSTYRDFPRLLKRHPWILMGAALMVASVGGQIHWFTVLVFHFFFWAMLPMMRPDRFGKAIRKSYRIKMWSVTLACMMLVLLLVQFPEPVDLLWFSERKPMQWLWFLFYVWSYFHISASFVVSGANPEWLKRLIHPELGAR